MAVQIFTYCRPDWKGSFHVKLCLGSGQGYIISQENRSCADITKQPLYFYFLLHTLKIFLNKPASSMAGYLIPAH